MLEVHAAAAAAVPLPGDSKAWSPEQVFIEDKPAAGMRRDDDGILWVFVPQGTYRVTLKGKIPSVDRLAGTILYYLATGKVPELDKFGRPVMYYSELIHDNCRRRGHFDAGEFLTDWNDPKQKDWCMVQKGCKGPITHADCPIRRWNDGINFCIDCGSVCNGCAEPGFYAKMTPLYTADSETLKNIYAQNSDPNNKKNT